MKRFLCLLFVFSFLLLGFASCGGKEPAAATAGGEATVPVTEGATEGTAEVTTAGEISAATTDRWNVIAPKVTIIAEKYRRLKYQICTFGDAVDIAVSVKAFNGVVLTIGYDMKNAATGEIVRWQ